MYIYQWLKLGRDKLLSCELPPVLKGQKENKKLIVPAILANKL
jgi:hypothetical protein